MLIGLIEKNDGEVKTENRYYITSLDWEAGHLLKLSRDHWHIENQLHRTLDIHFQEDACQKHDRNAAANLSLLRKLGLSLLKQIESKNKMIIKKRKLPIPQIFGESVF